MADLIGGFDWDAGNRDKCRKRGVSLADMEAPFRGRMVQFEFESKTERVNMRLPRTLLDAVRARTAKLGIEAAPHQDEIHVRGCGQPAFGGAAEQHGRHDVVARRGKRLFKKALQDGRDIGGQPLQSRDACGHRASGTPRLLPHSPHYHMGAPASAIHLTYNFKNPR